MGGKRTLGNIENDSICKMHGLGMAYGFEKIDRAKMTERSHGGSDRRVGKNRPKCHRILLSIHLELSIARLFDHGIFIHIVVIFGEGIFKESLVDENVNKEHECREAS